MTPTHSVIDRLDLPDEVIELSKSGTGPDAIPPRISRESLFWLLATVMLFMTGLFKGINLLVLLAYLLAGIWLLNRLLLRSAMRRIRGRRLPPGPIFAGKAIDLSIELACTGRRAVRGLIVVDNGAGHRRRWLLLSLKPGQPLRIRHRETFPNRGRHRVDALHARSSFPFGLSSSGADLATVEEWIVLPRLGRIHMDQMRQWLARVQRGDGRTRRRRLLPAPQEADIHGLRDFRFGDSPRWIHWRTSARRNQLLVREFEDSSQPHLVLVVEPWLPANATVADRERLEAVISLAGTIVRDWCRDFTARMSLIVNAAKPVIFENGTGNEFALHLLEALATELGMSESASIDWLQTVRRGVSTAPFLVITSKADSALPAALSGELGRAVATLEARELPHWYERPLPTDIPARNN
jgi:uncharacterized protein (DUF58 family)